MKAVLLLWGLASVAVASPALVISAGPGTRRAVALTFDAGADRGYAGQILSTLEREHVKATFGMTGLWAKQNPDLVRRMARDGDVLMNHTYDHRSFTGLSTKLRPLTDQQRVWEIQSADAVIRSITGRSTRPFFRPPYGDMDRAMLSLVQRLGYRYVVMWTVDSLGWQGLRAPSITRRCLDGTRPGAILLMHVGIQSQDALALPDLIHGLRKRGYRLQTIPALLGTHRLVKSAASDVKRSR